MDYIIETLIEEYNK